jgi:hypothetical protein
MHGGRLLVGLSSRVQLRRHWRVAAVPLALALPPLLWVADATRRASFTTLGRDQGIFQFIAGALSRGAIDYRDVRDVNGPLIHLVHLVFLGLGGADEHRFHVLDLAVTGVSFAAAGACVPSIGSSQGPGLLERVLWALAAWVTLSGQYLLYGFWDIAQRESFLDWFMLPAVALPLVAQRPYSIAEASRARPARRIGLFVLMGALSVIPWFGKPTFALFTVAQLVALLVDRGSPVPRARAFSAFAIGGAAGAATQVAFLVRYGDPLAFLRIQLVDVPAMYRFIWPRSPFDVLSTPFFGGQALAGIAGSVLLLVLIASGDMAVRALGVALAPVCGIASVLVQAKGFPYHFHPVTAGLALQAVVLAAWFADRLRVAGRRGAFLRFAPIALAIGIALHVGSSLFESPYLRDPWLLVAAAEKWTGSSEYFAHFVRVDFFPGEMRQAAAFVRARTRPEDSVQTYGMDPYVLFLADRRTATPYIYAYDLNADVALAGGTGARPDREQTDRIRRIRDAHEADLLARMSVAPPAALIFTDGSPLLSQPDAWEDFAAHCAKAALWVETHYREAAQFGHQHVWLPPDGPSSSRDSNRK